MFPGDPYCPITTECQTDYASYIDQIQLMVELLGNLCESEIVKFKNEKTIKYLNNLPQKKKKNLKRIFPGSDKHTLDLFTQLLKFDVDKRISVNDALQHLYFKDYINDKEKKENKIMMRKLKRFGNISFVKDRIYGSDYYRSLILNEVLAYNKNEFWRFVNSDALIEYKGKVDVIVYGYIRQRIQPLFLDCIPCDIVHLLYSIFKAMITI